MQKKLQHSYICITLFKQDIKELCLTCMKHLQNVEILIDDIHITNISQLEQFHEVYQASSIDICGYLRIAIDVDAEHLDENQRFELRINHLNAGLTYTRDKNAKVEPAGVEEIKRVLSRCQNRIHAGLVGMAYLIAFFAPIAPVANQRISIYTWFIILIGGILSVACFIAFGFIMRYLKLDRYVFLLPGTLKDSRIYGEREVKWTLFVALAFLIVLSVLVSQILPMIIK